MRRLVILAVALATACSTTPELASRPTSTTTTQAQGSTTMPVARTTTTASESSPPPSLPPLQSLAYDEVAAMDFPIHMVSRHETESLVATKDGRIWTFDGSSVSNEPILDISDQVRNEGEQGLLAIAVHPDDDRRLFVHYSGNDGGTVVEEYSIQESGTVLTEPIRELLRLGQPARNHNGGMIQFGPDGFLYLGLGDGGGSNDRFGNGQNRDSLLGGLVRIDVDDPDPELFQYGLRNPWRFWIDGDLIYIADVGQNAFEEVNVSQLTPDVNYGWPITEGLHCFQDSSGCAGEGIHFPIVEVAHGDAGTCSITGGITYTGDAIPEIQGMFFYSDFCGGYLRSFRHLGAGVAEDERDWTDQVGDAGSVASFGSDHTGEMYVLTTDHILKVVAVR